MKKLLQKMFVVCSIASMAGLAYGYSYSIQNETGYPGQIDLKYSAPNVCGTDTIPVPANNRVVTWGNSSGCLPKEIVGHIIYNNPDDPVIKGPVTIHATEENRWSSGGTAGRIDFVMTLSREPGLLPVLRIERRSR
jgi:hypothetical protein